MEKLNQTKISLKHGSCLCTFYNNGKANIMVIDSVWVDENHRNLGVGTSIMNEAIKFASTRNVDAIELIVNEGNTVAKNLYKKLGFQKTNKEHYRIILNKIK